MKVLDLQCQQQHVFEGWFASEDDYLSQLSSGLLECPLCGQRDISKMLSAPRLNLGNARSATTLDEPAGASAPAQRPAAQAASTELVSSSVQQQLQSAWLTMARRIMASTDDVGPKFADEARKMHYGEVPERGIRGQASRAETEALLEEGIDVMPLPLPAALKEPLQ